MESLFNPAQIVEIVFEGLAAIKGVFDFILIMALIPSIIGGARRSIVKTLLRIVIYAAILITAYLMIDKAANFVGDELLQVLKYKIAITVNESTTMYGSVREFFMTILSQSSASPEMIEGLTQTLLKNIAWMIVFPVSMLVGYLLSIIIWPIFLMFFPSMLRKKIKKRKLWLINIPLSAAMTLALALIAIAPYANLSHALSNVVVDPASPIAFISPYYSQLLGWFTPSGSYILEVLQPYKILDFFKFFDTFKLVNDAKIYELTQVLQTVLNEIGAITA